MEDTQDKIRRNLVVFSSAIVIGWFLNLKLTAITKLFVSSSDIDNVDAGRLWLVTLTVLIYLSLRYRFDDTTVSQIDFLLTERRDQRRNYLSKYLQRKIARINRTGKFLPIFAASLEKSVCLEKEKYRNECSQNIFFRLHMSNPWSEESPISIDEPKAIWNGRVGIKEEYLKEGSIHTIATHSGLIHDFSVPLSGRIWIKLHSYAHIMLYSKSAVELVVPVVLAVFAMLITGCRLITIYLN